MIMCSNGLCLMILMCCFLVHACNARHHLHLHKGKALRFIETRTGSEILGDHQHQMQESSHEKRTKINAKDEDESRWLKKKKKVSDSGYGEEEKLSTAKNDVVSWRLPPGKRHDQHPGVYSDYPKPRPRPPTHN